MASRFTDRRKSRLIRHGINCTASPATRDGTKHKNVAEQVILEQRLADLDIQRRRSIQAINMQEKDLLRLHEIRNKERLAKSIISAQSSGNLVKENATTTWVATGQQQHRNFDLRRGSEPIAAAESRVHRSRAANAALYSCRERQQRLLEFDRSHSKTLKCNVQKQVPIEQESKTIPFVPVKVTENTPKIDSSTNYSEDCESMKRNHKLKQQCVTKARKLNKDSKKGKKVNKEKIEIIGLYDKHLSLLERTLHDSVNDGQTGVLQSEYTADSNSASTPTDGKLAEQRLFPQPVKVAISKPANALPTSPSQRRSVIPRRSRAFSLQLPMEESFIKPQKLRHVRFNSLQTPRNHLRSQQAVKPLTVSNIKTTSVENSMEHRGLISDNASKPSFHPSHNANNKTAPLTNNSATSVGPSADTTDTDCYELKQTNIEPRKSTSTHNQDPKSDPTITERKPYKSPYSTTDKTGITNDSQDTQNLLDCYRFMPRRSTICTDKLSSHITGGIHDNDQWDDLSNYLDHIRQHLQIYKSDDDDDDGDDDHDHNSDNDEEIGDYHIGKESDRSPPLQNLSKRFDINTFESLARACADQSMSPQSTDDTDDMSPQEELNQQNMLNRPRSNSGPHAVLQRDKSRIFRFAASALGPRRQSEANFYVCTDEFASAELHNRKSGVATDHPCAVVDYKSRNMSVNSLACAHKMLQTSARCIAKKEK